MSQTLVRLLMAGILFFSSSLGVHAKVISQLERNVENITMHVTILTRTDGDASEKSNVPTVHRRDVQREVEEVFRADPCVYKLPLNKSDRTQAGIYDNHLIVAIKIAVQDSLDGAICSYAEGCSYASMHFFVKQGRYSTSSHIPRLIAASNKNLKERLIEAAVADAKTFIDQAFPNCPERY